MARVVVRPQDMVRAVGQAVIIMSGDRRYFTAELGLVIPRIAAAAALGQMLFIMDDETKVVNSFACVAFLDNDAAFEWRHRRRAPSHNDFKSGNNAWLTDYSWATVDDAALLGNFVRMTWPDKAQLQFHADKADYPLFEVMSVGDKK
jgi:hemolysin-activating ACP:hemolysin acyltransferase